ncbi:PAS domain-containing sensor histidine kinase [Oscillatoria acuminata]|uniref:histidine kinase n=1 Tax=Oscillatoria acuminata PCC 6304 TaxID=56110 RepID=K9TN30_9CYAN|nr:PAS domain-containing sensor histidine kinase [Oscillatoria acuminata]AFY83960.1 PAS domain S-box [Oscillatoria acuminata PCC 6304]
MENFTGQIEQARVRLEQMQQLAQEFSSPPPDLLEQVFGELSTALEELHVATEELQEQNQQLLSTREEVEIERERYQQLFEEAPDPYLVTNALGVIEEANAAAEQLFNWRRPFLIAKPLAVFVVLEERSAFRSQLEQLKTVGPLTEWEVQMLPRDRESFPAAISVSRVQDIQGNPMGFRWLIRNISDLKEAEKNRQDLAVQRELHLMKSRFIQILSNEFRTPLNTIHLCTQLLERYSDGVKQSKRSPIFEKIRGAIKQMTLLLDDILIFNEDKDSSYFKSFQVDLEKFCLKLIEEYKHLYNPGERSINFQATGDYPSVCINTKLFRHIFRNILSNCFKFTPESSEINVFLHCEKTQIVLTFRDQGLGILPEDLPHLFNIFYRGNNVGDIPGAGLGLAIVKKSVDLLGGEISLDSPAEGVGTNLIITLPTTPKSPSVNKRLPSPGK